MNLLYLIYRQENYFIYRGYLIPALEFALGQTFHHYGTKLVGSNLWDGGVP